MLRNMKIGTKLIVTFLLVGLVPLGTISVISLLKSKSAIETNMDDQLIAVRDSIRSFNTSDVLYSATLTPDCIRVEIFAIEANSGRSQV